MHNVRGLWQAEGRAVWGGLQGKGNVKKLGERARRMEERSGRDKVELGRGRGCCSIPKSTQVGKTHNECKL